MKVISEIIANALHETTIEIVALSIIYSLSAPHYTGGGTLIQCLSILHEGP